MIAGNYECLLREGSELAENIYGIMVKEQYRPAALIQYQRRAFAVPVNSIRITFDSRH